jgi:hypothetical protein
MTSIFSLDLMPPFKRRKKQVFWHPPRNTEVSRPTGRNSCEPENRRRSDRGHDLRFLACSQVGLFLPLVCRKTASQRQRPIDQKWLCHRRTP